MKIAWEELAIDEQVRIEELILRALPHLSAKELEEASKKILRIKAV